MSRRKLATTVYLPPEQLAELQAVNAATGIPIARLIRDGVDAVLKREGLFKVSETTNETHGRK